MFFATSSASRFTNSSADLTISSQIDSTRATVRSATRGSHCVRVCLRFSSSISSGSARISILVN